MTILQNQTIKLRALEPEDLEMLYLWENNSSLWIHGNTLSPYSRLVLRQYISEAQSQDIYQAKQLRLMIVCQENNSILGTVDLYDFDPHNSRVGVGILIDEKYRKKSYASQTLKIIEKYVFEFLHLNQLYAYIASDNEKSISTFEKCGYQKSGTLKDWVCNNSTYKTVYVYQRIKNDTSI